MNDRRPDFWGLRDALALLILAVLAVYTRFPPWLNADALNSDVAIVGLQARHVLQGEWSPFLLGSGYQTSVDSTWAALVFACFGDSARALYGSAIALHLVVVFAGYALLREAQLPRPYAAGLATLLACTTASANSYAIYPPREASIALGFVALWLGERSRKLHALGMLSGLMLGLSVFADPYARLFLPMWLMQRALLVRERPLRATLVDFLGLLLGVLPAIALAYRPGASAGQASLSLAVVGHNLDLLRFPCGPWAFGAIAYHAPVGSTYVPWLAPLSLAWVQTAGMVCFLGLTALAAGVALARSLRALSLRNSVLPVDRTAVVMGVGFCCTVAGFLVSPMVMDHFSMRYLALATLCAPMSWLALPGSWRRAVPSRRPPLGEGASEVGRGVGEGTAPTSASRVGSWIFRLAFLFALFAQALGGWISHAPYTRGALPLMDPSAQGGPERELFVALSARGVTYATADYWASYRLTFLSQEKTVVVPTNPAEDRYPPFRRAFEQAARVAYVWDADRSRESREQAVVAAAGLGQIVEQFRVGTFVVFVLSRAKAEDKLR
jgi:hypothetical protein